MGSMFDQMNNIQGGGIALPSETITQKQLSLQISSQMFLTVML